PNSGLGRSSRTFENLIVTSASYVEPTADAKLPPPEPDGGSADVNCYSRSRRLSPQESGDIEVILCWRLRIRGRRPTMRIKTLRCRPRRIFGHRRLWLQLT